ncbi:ATP-binding response regulator [Sideroxydans lithotrophicus]|uniref:histidine kinase n=1 Tax=Sideroxydans lithotrophicus (strain ES-1) TaxID=580332 RepID=D5CSQ6_SIDLE|nr:hybrid sensor histidine kinase/response regulator [Sideroxydans lithotrophicus]ADE11992.1 integral membrane sensor hybrid histidine kinase [Sideroxydans lithotrophicus ES-1]
MITPNEHKAIEAEQVKAYFNDANYLNLSGFAVFALLVVVVHEETPNWIWAPALAVLFLITLYRAYLIWQYHRAPERRTSTQWSNSQALTGGSAGVCWGLANTAMLAHLPVKYQLFVLTVSGVVAAASASEGFSLAQPPRVFTIASLTPPAIFLFTVGNQLHTVLGVMLLLLIPITIALGNKKNLIFTEVLRLRFHNEFLVTELSRQHELLEAASKSKSRFLAAASHDLRQPLAALILFLEQLELEQQLSPKGRGVLAHALLSTSSLSSLLDGLLDISRLDGHAIKPKIRPFPIQKLFDELEEEFCPLASNKGLRLRFAPCSSIVESDIILAEQILRNLISNAIRYTHSGRILVGCRHRYGMLSIEVHDTGIGIAEDQFPKIFDEFYQVDNSERDRQQGLGLGLSIVDRAARLLGHSVTLTSQLGKGSAFIVTLPLANPGEVVEQAVTGVAPEAPELAGRLIAFIENEGNIRVGISDLLQSWGCRVVVADSAATMLEQLEAMDDAVEMVISDFGLSRSINGVEAIAVIRRRWGERLPALLFTGDISKETYMLARDADLPILYKPAKAEALREAITTALESGKLQEVRE